MMKPMKLLLKIVYSIEFLFFYILKVLQANVELAWHIMRPKLHMAPGIIRVPVGLKHDQALLLLMNMISMTPGTLTIDLEEDKKHIYVHSLFLSDHAKSMQQVKQLEKRIAKLFN